MNAFDPSNPQPLWDFGTGQADYSALGQLGDDQFLDLLQRQFSSPDAFNAVPPVVEAVDPSKISALPQPGPPPPLSADSSPSPSSANEHSSASRRQSQSFDNADTERHKRKAPIDEDEDDDEEPSHKNAKKGPARRKSGNGQDETRLQKRKEQNRAAQRAFRERKEKHVKDLEDKVAALEQKNEQSQTENVQLRELLKRLQDENVMLKQAQFTFSVPKPNTQDAQPFNNVATAAFGSAPGSAFGAPGPSSGATPPSAASGTTPNSSTLDTPSSSFPADIDFGSLTSFDQTQLSLIDDSGDTNMTYDFGYGTHSGSGSLPSATPYKTIASNPMFMSFADPSPPSDFGGSPSSNGSKPAVLDLGAWGASPGSNSNSNNGGARSDDARRQNSFDELFGGHMFGAQSPMSPESFTSLMAGPGSTTLSPVLHAQRSPAASASNQPSPGEHSCGTDSGQCPRTRDEFQQVVNRAGPSPFAPAPSPSTTANKDSAASSPANNVTKGFQSDGSSMIMCKGASFPPTEKRDDNVEVLAAWRKITTDPSFKASNIDINELCAEFTDKARCDGTKIVLDQNGVNMILDRLRAKMQAKSGGLTA